MRVVRVSVDVDGSHGRLEDSFALVSYADAEAAEQYRFGELLERVSDLSFLLVMTASL